MKKRWISVLMTICMLLSLLPVGALAQETEPAPPETTVTEPTTTEPPVTEPTTTEPPVTEPTTTEPTPTEPPVEITGEGYAYDPATGTLTVTSNDGTTAWREDTDIVMTAVTTVVIQEGVNTIKDYAFFNCIGLTSVTIPSGVRVIGHQAFFNCIGLVSVTIPDSVGNAGAAAFEGCTGLTSVTTPITDQSMFKDCTSLQAVTFSGTVTKIGDSTFEGCTGLTSITIPDSVTDIRSSAFQDCTGLTSVTIPANVTSIGGYAFSGCTGLTDITIPASVTTIGGYAFSGCTGLTDITIPASVTTIGESAFAFCTGLTSVTIPGTVQSIGETAFGCNNLTSVTLSNGATSIWWNTFSFCDELESITIAGDSSGDKTIDGALFGALSSLKRQGYDMVGWVDAAGNPVTAETVIPAEGLVISPRWTATEYNDHLASVEVKGQAGEIDLDKGTVIFRLPIGATDAADFAVRTADPAATYTVQTATEGGTDWTITVTARNGITKATYTVVQHPAAENLAAVLGAKAQLETSAWTVPQATANDAGSVRTWMEGQLSAILAPLGVAWALTVDAVTPAAAGDSSAPDGTDGAFSFTAKLSKGTDTGDAYGAVTVTGTGVITATAYTPPAPPPSSGGGGGGGGARVEIPEEPVPLEPAPWENPFTDVDQDDWFYDAVAYVSGEGLMTGTTPTTFAPWEATSRAMIWTVLGRLAGETLDGTGSDWYAGARAWAMEAGVSDGTDPNGSITREQLAAMLWRYARMTGEDVSVGEDTNILSYGDAFEVSGYAIPAMQWACGAGVIGGKPGGLLDPGGTATRAEVATMLLRFCENVVK